MENIKQSTRELVLSIDDANLKCVDCDSENITKLSVNNGVTLCEECSLKHQPLGYNISYVISLDQPLDDYLINYIVLGSNSKFKRFLKEEKIKEDLPIESKYKTKAVNFYRINLKNKVLGGKMINKNYEDGNEILEKCEVNFPEFFDYHTKTKESKDKNKKSLLSSLGNGLLDISKKVVAGVKTGVIYGAAEVKKGAHFVAVNAGPAKEKFKQGANFVGRQVKNAYVGIKDKLNKEHEVAGKDANENNNKNNEQGQEGKLEVAGENEIKPAESAQDNNEKVDVKDEKEKENQINENKNDLNNQNEEHGENEHKEELNKNNPNVVHNDEVNSNTKDEILPK